MDYILRYPLNSDDIDFLNITTIEYEIHDTKGTAALVEANFNAGMHDSGWCDHATNARIIHEKDRAIFKNVTDTQLTFLQMKFGGRLRVLTKGLSEIYNIAQQHNVDTNTVIDSEGDA
jgi:hypothetical protein